MLKKISATNKLLESQDTQAGDITPEDVTTAAKDVLDAAKDDIQKAIEDTPDAVAEWATGKATEKLQSSLSGFPFGIWDKFSEFYRGNVWEMIKNLCNAYLSILRPRNHKMVEI